MGAGHSIDLSRFDTSDYGVLAWRTSPKTKKYLSKLQFQMPGFFGICEKHLIAQVAGTRSFLVLLTDTSDVLVMGDVPFSSKHLTKPRTIKGLKLRSVHAGENFCVGVDLSGNLWSLGSGANGALGLGDTNDALSFSLICGLGSAGRVVQVACGATHCAAVTEFGELYLWGGHGADPLPDDSASAGVADSQIPLGTRNRWDFCTPHEVEAVRGLVTRVSCGNAHTAVLTRDGHVLSWGANRFGQCGQSRTQHEVRHPTRVGGPLEGRVMALLSCGGNHTIAVDQMSRELFTWGQHMGGGYPQRVDMLSGYDIIDISCNQVYSLVLTRSNEVFYWLFSEKRQSAGLIASARRLNLDTVTYSTINSVYSGYNICAILKAMPPPALPIRVPVSASSASSPGLGPLAATPTVAAASAAPTANAAANGISGSPLPSAAHANATLSLTPASPDDHDHHRRHHGHSRITAAAAAADLAGDARAEKRAKSKPKTPSLSKSAKPPVSVEKAAAVKRAGDECGVSVDWDDAESKPAAAASVPEFLTCPLTRALLEHPVFCADGFTYERQAIVHWFMNSNHSPVTGEILRTKTLRDNWNMIAQVNAFRESLAAK
eukprot:comp23795_c0_seq1/m.59333 comp23795_c0_seq1/g.59333  ORF comp23795_c0_seq1/g.59333 comp23795_c0_seq1/m.59333 type:complete len:603 (+) comp23795_c0_seq1:236-2044(+)